MPFFDIPNKIFSETMLFKVHSIQGELSVNKMSKPPVRFLVLQV